MVFLAVVTMMTVLHAHATTQDQVQDMIDSVCRVTQKGAPNPNMPEAASKCLNDDVKKKECCGKTPKEQVSWSSKTGCNCNAASQSGAASTQHRRRAAGSSSGGSPAVAGEKPSSGGGSAPFDPSKLEGKCLDAMRAYNAAMDSGGTALIKMSMEASMGDIMGDIPQCCIDNMQTVSSQPTPASQKPSCMGAATAFSVGMSLSTRCTPPDGDYAQMQGASCYVSGKCSSPCAFQTVAFNSSNYREIGMVFKADGSSVSFGFSSSDLAPTALSGSISEATLAQLKAKFVLKMTCNALMSSMSSSSSKCPAEMGPQFCSTANRHHITSMLQTQDTMMRLQKNGDCDFGMGMPDDTSSSCGMLSLHPAKVLYFLCGSANVGGKQQYCGDWVSNPDGQCSESDSGKTHETCSITSGPVKILESECAGNAFLKKFAKDSSSKPHCGPLLRGGCCAGSLFFALTDSDEASMWPLCVRTWATQTCGVDLTPCNNNEVERTFIVELSLTITTSERRLGKSVNSCSNHEAKLLSGKMGGALGKTSAKAGAAGAKAIVLSDSSCLDGGAQGRTVVTSFVLQGSGADARSKDVHAALATAEFQSQLSAQGVQATNITVKGLAPQSGQGDSTSGGSQLAPAAIAMTAVMALAFGS